MNFRHRTLFAIMALAGALFFLARINPWLPVLPLVMFGPLTVVFFKRPTWLLATIVATWSAWLAGLVAVSDISSWGWGGITYDLFGVGVYLDGLYFKTALEPFEFKLWFFGLDASLDGHSSDLYFSHFSLMLSIIAYGLGLQLLALRLKRHKAKAEQPA